MPPVRSLPLWRAAQALGVVLTLVLLAALARWPTDTLHVLWDMVIPVLPAVFLVNPLIWRNVCPLATLNTVTGARVGRRALAGRALSGFWVAGIVLLALMVPARRFLFNEHGTVLLGTIGVVAGLALALGLVFSRRSGFCNGLCPVLPVEKLYGQAPLLRVGTPRCTDCNLCAPVGCIDLAGGKSVAQSLGPSRRGMGWLLTPLGAFAAGFPGLVVGYFTTENVAPAAAWDIYANVALWVVVSFGFSTIAVIALDAAAAAVLPVLGGLAAGLYYWFAAPTLAAAYGAPEVGPAVVRVGALALVGFWFSSAVRRPVPQPSFV
jgi:hypothetical protein